MGNRVVVKIGTNTLSDHAGTPDAPFLADMARQIVGLRDQGHEVILVSSGAIGAGKAVMGMRDGVQDVRVKQALAAIGQPRLVQAWAEAFAPHGITVAQLLLTHHDFTSRASFLHVREATERLLSMGVVPIANENDTVSIEEIDASFGDNDRLSVYIATKTEADHLIILSDVAGLHTRSPGRPGSMRVPVVECVTPEVLAMVDPTSSSKGRGGMRSKLDAMAMATGAGVACFIAHGRERDVLRRLMALESIGTMFLPQGKSVTGPPGSKSPDS